MELIKLLFFMVILLISAFPKTSAEFEFLYELCGDIYTTPSIYQTNLNSTLSSMSSDTQITYGYYNFTAGKKPDKVEAMALCRSDITLDTCQFCVRSSVATLPVVCPDAMQAFGYSDNCLIYYTNYSAFHFLTDEPYWAQRFDGNVTKIPNYSDTLIKLLTSLQFRAASGNSEQKFATGKINVKSNQSLYGLVQCSPVLSWLNCTNCISYLLFKSLYMTKGGRIISPSCNLRFESYPFYGNVSYVAQPPESLTPATSNTITTSTQVKIRGKAKTSTVIIVVIIGSVASIMVIVASIYYLLGKRKKTTSEEDFNEDRDNLRSLEFSLGEIKSATASFADNNILGEGGFGKVYKGKLPNGQEIAVKRFASNSVQEEVQFKNEIQILAKLQHINLVRLLGFWLEKEEMLLIYEFVLNKSLDNFLFVPSRNECMKWETRFKIIKGIIKGLIYLHEDSRLRIIHRDLKASNVLLDTDFNPKIADFGIAKLFNTDESRAMASKVVGTHGYMPPEYALHGHVSTKSDVFGFGVLVLEIISGQRISSFQFRENPEGLLSIAWKKWIEGQAWVVVDPSLSSAFSSEILRCLHIGLLCVQHNMADRPAISTVAHMVSSSAVSLPTPSQPAFFTRNPTPSYVPS